MVIGLVVDDGAVSGGILRVARVEDGGQHLVIDLDETQARSAASAVSAATMATSSPT